MNQMPYDLLIIGAGTAGMPCAITAAENGATVCVIEKAGHIGGTLHISAGHMSAAGTHRQKEHGIRDTVDKHFADVMRLSKDKADPILVRLAVDEAPHTLDWLEKLGLPFVEDTPRFIYGHTSYSTPRTVWGTGGGKSIFDAMKPLWDEHVERGAITCLLEHTMTALVMENDAIIGVEVEHAGQTRIVNARSTVITTGGYGANPTFFKQVTPDHPDLLSASNETSTGDGIIAARRIGAAFRNADLHIPNLGGVEIDEGRADYNNVWAMLSTSLYRKPREIYINANARRFMAEDLQNAYAREHAVLHQPGHVFHVIFDTRALIEGAPLIEQWTPERIDTEAERGAYGLAKSETLSGLARKLDLSADALENTVKTWNGIISGGQHDPLGRTYLAYPVATRPFYALTTRGTVLMSFGGLTVDGTLRVIDMNGYPIPNLYAAGEAIGAGAVAGQTFSDGMMLTSCLSFGRILGQTLSVSP